MLKSLLTYIVRSMSVTGVHIKDIFHTPKSSDNEKFKWKDLIFFFRFVKPVWKLGALSIILSILISAIQSIMPMSTKVFIDFVIMKNGFDTVEGFLASFGMGTLAPGIIELLSSLNFVILALIVLGLTSGLSGILKDYLNTKYTQRITFNVQTTLFDRVLRFPMSFFKEKQTGYLVSRVQNDVGSVQYFFSNIISSAVSSSVSLVLGLLIILAISTKITLLVVLLVPVYLIVSVFFSGRMRRVSYDEMESSANVSKDLQEILSGVEVVKSYTSEEREVRKVSEKIDKVIKTRMKSTMISSFSGFIMRGVQSVFLLLVMWFGAIEIQNGAMTIGDYVAFIAYVAFLSGSVGRLFSSYISLQTILASMDRLKEMFSIVPEHENADRQLIVPNDCKGGIKFENVTFSYDDKDAVIKDLNLEVRSGGSVALIGPSGSGKTTIVNLILKLYTPGSGAIYLDGVDLRDIDTEWLRKQIAIVSQDVFLFDDTIENNIRYGMPSASREEVIEAAKKAHIHEFIESLPDSYATIIGERGVKLSGGQRQRIAIARAFLKDARILLLDEPTSALDTETEDSIKGSLRELIDNRTTFVISHKSSLIDITGNMLVVKIGT
ncbi:ABC transporter ATP-binding protein [Methanocella sp. CWC-04]|uniref:ABC transporter ATP-binding protein n=1 Tax=Methanooceanicella nereidis TaxID=2052831 RepID=A0AAP2RCI9_9EURY|nr:ABC transporter ATP-binding protein [Methanocella sp. CWC-04]MCD1294903.1 ABC transporter ATP-binding protein [Methanocella sp. CWC-04]